MKRSQLVDEIRKKKSYLCVGLDTDLRKIPEFLLKEKDPILRFNQEIIEATHDLCVAYKPNLAFYESQGSEGLASLEKTMNLIPEEIFTIADAKRGDIGNTAKMYADAFFNRMNFDSVTIAPYMGEDSIRPFLEYEDKWVILLALTSNAGSGDFQKIANAQGKPLYQSVIERAQEWANPDQLMYVVGATHPDHFASVRQMAKSHFFLVPGVGAQGGDLHKITQNGRNDDMGLLINSSRGIIYAGGNSKNFGEKVRQAALDLQEQMSTYF